VFDRLPIRRRVVVVLLPVLLALLVGIGVFLATRDDAGSVDPTPGPAAPAPDSEEEGAAGAAGGGVEDSSIEYADPRGFPVWEETILAGVHAVQPSGNASEARITADVVTRFADRTEPSVESDIAYLERADRDWRLAKASGTLYRAVGKPDFRRA
jgi:hypothetical protein